MVRLVNHNTGDTTEHKNVGDAEDFISDSNGPQNRHTLRGFPPNFTIYDGDKVVSRNGEAPKKGKAAD